MKIEDDFPVIDGYHLDAEAAAKFIEEQFLLFPDNGMDQSNSHLLKSSCGERPKTGLPQEIFKPDSWNI